MSLTAWGVSSPGSSSPVGKRIRFCPVRLVLALGMLLLAGCGMQPFRGSSVDSASFLERAIVQQDSSLRVTAAVPDAGETLALTGLDLYQQGIQPVWLKVDNLGDSPARIALWSIDRDYYSPIEVAYMNRKRFSSEGYEEMQKWLHDNGLQRQVPPGESRSGLVFTHLKPGTRGFNLEIFHSLVSHSFTFFVPMPGFTADYMQVDFATLYAQDEILQLDPAGLKTVLEEDLTCCTSGPNPGEVGGPINLAFVGTPLALRRSLLRADWRESEAESEDTLRARQHLFEGRPPDAIFHRQRKDGDERLGLLLWRAPWDVDGEPGWVGSVYYTVIDNTFLTRLKSGESLRDSAFLSRFVSESVSADLDGASRHLAQNFWYSQSLAKLGFVTGVGEASVDSPHVTFDGVAYFTNGLRTVLFLSEDPVALGETEELYGREYVRAGAGELFQGQQIPPPNKRLYSQDKGDLTVTTAVPSAEETETIFGADLYRKNIQPIWVQVKNRSDATLFLTPMGVDPAYYSPRESAGRIRADTDAQRSAELEKSGISRLWVAPRSIQSGYIFTPVDEGTKSFNVDVIGGAEPYLMSFFVPVPGLKLDHQEVDINGLYSGQEIKNLDLPQLVAQLEQLPCCVRDAAGEDRGDPLNLVFIGEAQDLYYAFLRAGWDETETIYGASLLKTAASALTGGRYRYSPVSALYVFDRPQDIALQRARSSIHERNHMRLWLTPLRLEGKPVWIGQISRDIGVRLTWRTITTHKIDPDVDETREFLLEDMAYSQALEKFGYVGGVGPAPYDQPRGNLTGDPYFTDGRRIVMWIADRQRSIADIEVVDLTPWYTGHIAD